LNIALLLRPPQQPGELGRLGPYRVLKPLGAGAMGVVFLAEDIQLSRPVALKLLRPALSSNPEGRARFLREARAAAALQHDHVVTVYQVGEDRGVPFLAMQLLEGEPLEQRLGREPRLPAREVLRLGREIAEGLAAAHARGLVHRDIKPSNIWLEAGRDRVKLLDFGLARAVGDEAGVTQTGAVVGSPAYMAPEQARGQRVGPHSDLFSLGCVLYRLCTGALPFKGGDTLATLTALALEEPPAVQTLNPALPSALSDLVRRLLSKDTASRPASAEEVVASLAAIEQGLLAAATLVTPPGAAPFSRGGTAIRPPENATELTPGEAPALPRWLPAAGVDVAAVLLFVSGVVFLVWALAGPR
jgi:serine/threonine protein kinase